MNNTNKMIGNKTAENMAGEQLLVQFDNINKNTKIKTPNAVNTFMINSSLKWVAHCMQTKFIQE